MFRETAKISQLDLNYNLTDSRKLKKAKQKKIHIHTHNNKTEIFFKII